MSRQVLGLCGKTWWSDYLEIWYCLSILGLVCTLICVLHFTYKTKSPHIARKANQKLIMYNNHYYFTVNINTQIFTCYKGLLQTILWRFSTSIPDWSGCVVASLTTFPNIWPNMWDVFIKYRQKNMCKILKHFINSSG